jgi:hypothetical protein
MPSWLRRVRGALLMGLTWAVLWAPIGLLIGMIVDPTGAMDEPWILVGTYPGFLGGVLFSIVLGVAARRRRLGELSVRRVALWGGAAGLVIGSLPFVLGDQGADVERVWLLPLIVVSSITVLASASAAGSLALAKRAERRELTGMAKRNNTARELTGAAERTDAAMEPRARQSTLQR